jgi:hypothetical protein
MQGTARFTDAQRAAMRKAREVLRDLSDLATEQADLLDAPGEEYDYAQLAREMTETRRKLTQRLRQLPLMSEAI